MIILNDWFNESAESKFNSFVHGSKSTANPNAILINGKASQKNSNGSSIFPKAKFYVKKNKRYRFRIINAGVVACPIQFSVQNHTFSVISSDGQPLMVENDVEAIVLYAGLNFKILFFSFIKSY